MRTETRMFFEAVLRDNRPISDFLDGKYTFLNESLAKHYGIEGVTGPEFRRVELTGDQRSGVLTQASVLTRHPAIPIGLRLCCAASTCSRIFWAPRRRRPRRTSPSSTKHTVGVAKSLRQQMEQHRADAVCASCHSRMDVLGFGLENYDAIGRWRTQDGKFPSTRADLSPTANLFPRPAEMKALAARQHAGVHPLPDREAADILRWAAAWKRSTAGPCRIWSRQTAAHDYQFPILSNRRLSTARRFSSGAARNRKAARDRKQMIVTRKALSQKNHSARHGRGPQPAVSRRHDSGVRGQQSARRTVPLRAAWFYVPNGIDMRHWTPAEEGALGELCPAFLRRSSRSRKTFSSSRT